jgi:hypothetical protein
MVAGTRSVILGRRLALAGRGERVHTDAADRRYGRAQAAVVPPPGYPQWYRVSAVPPRMTAPPWVVVFELLP